MGWYEKHVLPRFLNAAMKSPDMTRIRSEYVCKAEGNVLEIGIGSGLNLPHYNSGVRVTGVDPSAELQVYAQAVAKRCGTDVEFRCQGGEDIPAANHSFDSCVVTWTFCTIAQPELALAEVRRVLKPGGLLIFAEHGAAPEAKVAKWQDRINPVWKKLAGGCNLNRDVLQLLSDGGFKMEELVQDYIAGPKIATYTTRGVARMR